MNTVVIDGVTYTKASLLAKKFDYTTDYLGQLARASKISAQLVGRSWYIDESSLKHHSGRKVEAVTLKEKIYQQQTSPQSGEVDKVAITKPLSKTTQRHVTSIVNNKDSFYHVPVSVAYTPDEIELLPSLTKVKAKTVSMIEPEKVRVTLASSSKIKIHTSEKKTQLAFTQLPAIKLHGTLSVTPIELPQQDSKAAIAPIITPKKSEKSLFLKDPITSTKKSLGKNIQDSTLSKPRSHALSTQKNIRPSVARFSPQSVASDSARSVSKKNNRGAFTARVAFAVFLIGIFTALATLQLHVTALNDDTITTLKFSASLLQR